MKKILICILLYFCSCGRPPMENDEKLVIVKILTKQTTSDKIGCMYYIKGSSSLGMIKFRSESYFFDSCGKFNVGDTIKIVKK